MNKLILQNLDSITLRDKTTNTLTIHFCTNSSSKFPVGTEIDTDTYEGLQQVMRGNQTLFITEDYKSFSNRITPDDIDQTTVTPNTVVVNTNIIKSVKAKKEGLFNEESLFATIYSLDYSIKEIQEYLYQLREQVRETETLLISKRKEFKEIKDLVEIEYETRSFEAIKNKELPLIFKEGRVLKG